MLFIGIQRDWFSLKRDRKSTRLNSSHVRISYAVFCLKKKTKIARATARLRGLIPGNKDLALQLGIMPGAQALATLLMPLQPASAASWSGPDGRISATR